jgi:hypothetical protein
MTAGLPLQARGSALLAGVLSFASPKESSQRKGDPEGGAAFAGSLRYSQRRAAAELGAAPLRQSSPKAPDLPALLSAFHGDPKGVRARTMSRKKTGFHGQPEKTAKIEIGYSGTKAQTRLVSPGPLRGAEQRRGWRIKGEDCLRAQPEFRSPRQSRVAQGTGAAGTDLGVAFSLATFFWRSKRKYARQQGGTPSPSKLQVSISKP